MLNRPATDTGSEAGADARLRVMLILWGAFLMTVVMFFVIALIVRPEPAAGAGGEGDIPPLLYGLAALALSMVAASFVVKGGFYRRAAERRQPDQLQTGFILALALCESAALFGLVGLFVTGNDYAYALLALGALGEALHFPRRGQVEAAYFGRGI